MGKALFEKLQIKEVTSHFRNGWIFMVISAHDISFVKRIKKPDGSEAEEEEIVDVSKVRPLIIDKVVVKAKKGKNQGDGPN